VATGVVDKPSDLDVASVMAMGFPAPRGGLIFWADLVGAKNIVSALEGWAAALPPAAGFFAPCEYLKRCAAEGRKLSEGPAGTARSRL
jgi:enoyl-CoA hydratase/3-hydroxyacyl-CoA dehydrogenase